MAADQDEGGVGGEGGTDDPTAGGPGADAADAADADEVGAEGDAGLDDVVDPVDELDDAAGADDGGDDDGGDDDGDDDGDELVYELDDWSGESRLLADGLFENAGIARVWQGGTLVVRAEDEAAVDEIIDNVDAMAVPPLDPDAEKVAYEVGDWTDAQRTGLAQRLGGAGGPRGGGEDGGPVRAAEGGGGGGGVFDAIETPDELDATLGDEDDGLAAQEVLSDLFVSSDRLMHDARDSEGVLTFVDAAARAATLSLPFGFERGVWDEIVARAGALATDFEQDVDDDDLIVGRATELRNLLRSYV